MVAVVQSGRFGVAWSPLSIPGLRAWYDASDAATITSSGGAVSQWDDKSGLGYHFTATGTAKPTTGTNTINGKNVLTFDGSNDTMTCASHPMTGKTAGTVLWVAKSSRTGDQGPSARFGDDYHAFGGAMYETFGTNSRRNFAHGVTLTAAHIFTIVSAASDHRAYIDGTSKFTSTSNTVAWGSYTLTNAPPAAPRWGGDFAELVMYDTALSTTDRETVRDYLNTKWAVY